MDGYMTIGEVARVKQVSIKALRYYEKIGILKPAYCDPGYGIPLLRKMSRCWLWI